jgi:ElaB/YqjD/DUF883 family membrane-anchored ribosome-binding protein
MDQERSEVRQVEQARERVAQDVRSVAENANVVERAKENIQGRIDDAKGAVADRASDVRDRVSDVRDNLQDRVQGMARNIPIPGDNPMGMLLAGVALGFLVGMVLPVTRFESERLGPVADDMKDRVRQARTEVVRRGGEVIKETLEAARETATNSIREQGKDLGLGQQD